MNTFGKLALAVAAIFVLGGAFEAAGPLGAAIMAGVAVIAYIAHLHEKAAAERHSQLIRRLDHLIDHRNPLH